MTKSEQHAVTATPPIFVARGLTKFYLMGEVQALRGVDLDLYAGEFVVLLGPSGSGKSTLLNILGGLDTPTSGTVRYADHDLTLYDDALMTQYRRSHVGFVFQFYNLIPSLTARENVALVTEIAEHPMTPEEALALVGLEQRMDHFPTQLSGGEQQGVALALVQRHRDAGALTAIVTATNSFVTGPIALEFGIPHLIATIPAQDCRSGRYTGKPHGQPSFREGKIARVEAWLESLGWWWGSFARSYFYSDSHNDLPLLKLVSDPVAVDPDDILRAHAGKMGWPIISLR